MKPKKESAYRQATDLLARTAAIGITFFGTGPTFTATAEQVREFVSGTYGASLAGIASLIWFGVIAVSIWAFTTLFIAAVVQIGGAKLSQLSFKNK